MFNQSNTIAVVLAAAAIFLSGCDAPTETVAEQATPVVESTPVVAEAPDATPRPRIVFEETYHDFGVITDTVPVKYEFVFWNRGDAVLIIKDIKVSGSGTRANMIPIHTPPGEQNFIPVVFKPKGRTGHQAKSIRVVTNDPENRTVNLRISADVLAAVSIEPRVIRFDQVEAGHTKTVTGTVRLRGDGFKATNVGVNGEFVSARLLDSEIIEVMGLPATMTTFEVTVHEDAPLGWLDRRVTFRTNNPEKPAIEVPIWANVLGPIEIQPAKLPLGVVRAGVPFRRELRLVSRAGDLFKLSGWKIDLKNNNVEGFDMTVEVTDDIPEEGVSILRLIVTGTGPDQIGKLEGAIIIQTTMDNRPINIPFHCVVRPSK